MDNIISCLYVAQILLLPKWILQLTTGNNPSFDSSNFLWDATFQKTPLVRILEDRIAECHLDRYMSKRYQRSATLFYWRKLIHDWLNSCRGSMLVNWNVFIDQYETWFLGNFYMNALIVTLWGLEIYHFLKIEAYFMHWSMQYCSNGH